LRFGTNNTERMRLDSSGNLGLGTTSPNLSGGSAGSQVITVSASSSGRNGILELNGTRTTSGDYVGYVRFFNNAAATPLADIQAIRGSSDTTGVLAFATSGSERARIDSSGQLIITGGSSQPSSSVKGINLSPDPVLVNPSRFSCGSATGSITQIEFINGNGTVGSITTSGSATSYATSSDYRLKDNQQPLTGSGAFIDALQPKTWNWKADGSRGVGFIAHEVQAVSPGSVVGEKDGEQMQAMEYGSAEFIANIIAELQSLRKRLADAGIA